MGDCGCDSAAADEEENVGKWVEVEGWAVGAFEEDGDLFGGGGEAGFECGGEAGVGADEEGVVRWFCGCGWR